MERRLVGPNLSAQSGAAGHLKRMPDETEPRHVRDSMNAGNVAEVSADRVETRGGGDKSRVALLAQAILFQRRAVHAHAERLGENEPVAGPGAAVFKETIGMDKTKSDQAVNGFGAVD